MAMGSFIAIYYDVFRLHGEYQYHLLIKNISLTITIVCNVLRNLQTIKMDFFWYSDSVNSDWACEAIIPFFK
jgi:hypothetical protein